MRSARRATLDRYFDAMRAHDWKSLASCLAGDVQRSGPYLDEVRGRDAYATSSPLSRRSFPEALRFAFDADDRIARVDVYLKQPPPGAHQQVASSTSVRGRSPS